MVLNLASGKSRTQIYEFPIPNEDNVLYNGEPQTIEYGFMSGNDLSAYGANGENNTVINYGGQTNSAGTHTIHLSRPLARGEKILFNWYNGYQLIIYEEDGKTKARKPSGGSYNEIGKWANDDGSEEHTAIRFDDDMLTKRFDKIEIRTSKEIK